MDFYPEPKAFDLRDELATILHGDFTQPGVAQKVLVRRIRDQKCVCFETSTGSPDPTCRYCGGEGFLWRETMEDTYVAKNFGSVINPSAVISEQNAVAAVGTLDENRCLAFFEYTAFPNYERYLRPDHPVCDKLYELKVDFEGRLVYPLVRTAKWKIKSLTPHRGDNGRVEFFEVGCEKESL